MMISNGICAHALSLISTPCMRHGVSCHLTKGDIPKKERHEEDACCIKAYEVCIKNKIKWALDMYGACCRVLTHSEALDFFTRKLILLPGILAALRALKETGPRCMVHGAWSLNPPHLHYLYLPSWEACGITCCAWRIHPMPLSEASLIQ